MSRVEIIDTEKEADPAGELLANDRSLMLTVGTCEQNAGDTSGGTDNYPAFWATVIRKRRHVLHEVELQHSYKEIDCGLVLSHNKRNQLEV